LISPAEWDSLCLLIEEAWPYPFDDTTAKAWRVLLDDYDASQVLAAVKACVARGMSERPPVSALVAEIRCDPDKPTFAQALTSIYGRDGVLRARAQVRKARWEAGERDRLNDEAAWKRTAELHPLVGAFVRAQGLQRLRSLDLDDPQWGSARRKLLAAEWEELVDVAETRDVAALVAGRRGELGKLDPLRVLPAGPQLEVVETAG
jgi:hypothetical protein